MLKLVFKYAESLETMAFPDTPLITNVIRRHLCTSSFLPRLSL